MHSLSPTSTCGKLQLCNTDCYETVCADCDHWTGTGKTASTSEFGDCVKDAQFAGSTTTAAGRCYNVASKDYKAAGCTTDPVVGGCTDVVQFFRGACRDNANWSNMTSATGI